jgi:hypothetical protein
MAAEAGRRGVTVLAHPLAGSQSSGLRAFFTPRSAERMSLVLVALPLSESGSLFTPEGQPARGRQPACGRANHRDPVMPPHLPGGNAGIARLDRQRISALD